MLKIIDNIRSKIHICKHVQRLNVYGSLRFNKPILQQELAYFGTVFCKPTFLDIRSLLSSTFQCLINNDEFILSLYLNDALSMENAAIEILQTRIKQTRLQDQKYSHNTI
jgi:hypothetical protein